MRPTSDSPSRILVEDEPSLRAVIDAARGAHRLAVDVEADGIFAYRARPCIVQLAWDGGQRVAVVDVLATPIEPLGELLGDAGPVKIVHDVAFDARLLAERGIALGNVHDTAVAARMLSRAATGLASLLESELGVHLFKTLQHHDWRVRPLDEKMLAYLTADVVHLEALETRLWQECAEHAHALLDAVLEETRYRLASAIAASSPPQQSPPPYVRVKGAARLPEAQLAVLRAVAELREREAERRDVPPHKVAPADALLAVARSRPATVDELGRIRGFALTTPAARAFAADVVRSVAAAGDVLPEGEFAAYFDPPRMPAEEARARRQREVRLIAWRRAEAKGRNLDEQVILPGHCLQDAVDRPVQSVADLARVPGIGAFRLAADGDAIVQALRGDGAPA